MHDALAADFAARLANVCEAKQIPVRGRPALLAQRFKVSREAARKWLAGEGLPRTSTLQRISEWGGVTEGWLLRGAHSHLTPNQERALSYLSKMDPERQELAIRLLAEMAK